MILQTLATFWPLDGFATQLIYLEGRWESARLQLFVCPNEDRIQTRDTKGTEEWGGSLFYKSGSPEVLWFPHTIAKNSPHNCKETTWYKLRCYTHTWVSELEEVGIEVELEVEVGIVIECDNRIDRNNWTDFLVAFAWISEIHVRKYLFPSYMFFVMSCRMGVHSTLNISWAGPGTIFFVSSTKIAYRK